MFKNLQHFISIPFIKAIRKSATLNLLNFSQISGGWNSLIQCSISNKIYMVRIEEVRKPVPADEDFTVDQLIAQGGFNASS